MTVDEPSSDISPELEEKLAEQEILRQSLDAAKQKEKDLYDQLLRLGAEFDNYRKRAESRVQEARRNGREDILLHLITMGDALIQAVVATENASDMKAVKTGLKMVHDQFEKFLRDQGLVPVKSVGEKLDPHRHEAILQVETDDVEEGQIVDEIQRGYTWNDRLVRPARVKVAVKSKLNDNHVKQEENHG